MPDHDHIYPSRTPEYQAQYRQQPQVKLKKQQYNKIYYDENKVEIRRKRVEFEQKPEIKLKRREYSRKPKVKAKKKIYDQKPEARSKKRKAQMEYAATHPEVILNGRLKKHEKLEAKCLEIAGRTRPDRCDVCGNEGRIVFDHHHGHGQFRGFLCNRCNLVLGHVKDDPILLELLAAYLRESQPIDSS